MQTDSKGPSQRQLRVGQEVRRILGKAFSQGAIPLQHVDCRLVTLTEARVSPDLKHARVYASLLHGEKNKDFLDDLKQAAPLCRKILSQELRMKMVPVVKFTLDETLESTDRIESLFRNPKVKKDLERSDPDDS